MHVDLSGLTEEIFDAMWPWVLGCSGLLGAFGFVSRIPAKRGHWSVLILAAPPLLIGACCIASISSQLEVEDFRNKLTLLFIVPSLLLFALGVVSVTRRAICWRLKKAQASQEKTAACSVR